MNISSHILRLPAEHEGNPRVTAEHESLERWWSHLAPELARVAAALGLSERCGDVVQDVYLTARDKAPRELSREELRRWLLRVTANRCRLEHRRRGRLQRLLALLHGWTLGTRQPHDAASQPAEQEELSACVERALDRLPAADREIVVLRYFCELDSRHIGEMLAMPEGTVRSRLARARKQLAVDLASWNEED